MVPEALANIPTTAHILGGAVIGADAQTDRSCSFGHWPFPTRRSAGAAFAG